MPNLTISVDEALMRQIKAHPSVNWSEAAREGLRRRLREIHVWDELLKGSQLSEDDVKRLGREVDEEMLRRLKDQTE